MKRNDPACQYWVLFALELTAASLKLSAEKNNINLMIGYWIVHVGSDLKKKQL